MTTYRRGITATGLGSPRNGMSQGGGYVYRGTKRDDTDAVRQGWIIARPCPICDAPKPAPRPTRTTAPGGRHETPPDRRVGRRVRAAVRTVDRRTPPHPQTEVEAMNWLGYLPAAILITVCLASLIRDRRATTRRIHHQWITDAARGRHRAESDALWDEFDAGERMPGLDEDRKWNG